MVRRTSPTVALLKYIVDLFIEMYLVDNKYAGLAMNLKKQKNRKCFANKESRLLKYFFDSIG